MLIAILNQRREVPLKEVQGDIGTIDLLKYYDIARSDTSNTTLICHISLKDLNLARPDSCNSVLWKFLLWSLHKDFSLAKSYRELIIENRLLSFCLFVLLQYGTKGLTALFIWRITQFGGKFILLTEQRKIVPKLWRIHCLRVPNWAGKGACYHTWEFAVRNIQLFKRQYFSRTVPKWI